MNYKRSILLAITLILNIIFSGCASVDLFYSGTKSEAVEQYNVGQKLFERGRYSEAVSYFQKVVDEYPDNPMAEVSMYYLGACYKERKERDKALSIYRKLIDKYKKGFWVKMAKKDIGELEQK